MGLVLWRLANERETRLYLMVDSSDVVAEGVLRIGHKLNRTNNVVVMDIIIAWSWSLLSPSE